MTNEEAIRYFKRHIDLYCVDGISREAEEMAIKALEQQPCDDAVSREAVIEILENYGCTNREGLIFKDIRALPPVTQKYGKWIGHREHCEDLGVIPSGLGAYEWCSSCDCGIDVREWHRNHYNYCPNCGARMESEDKE